MIECLIVDDEPLARQVLERHVSRTGELHLIASCGSASEAFGWICRQPVDLMFLDIRMPLVTGMEFFRSLKSPPAVIFTTAHPEYAAGSYDLEAVDYLLKPITYARFRQGLTRYIKASAPVPPAADHTYFKVDGSLVRVAHGEIIYAQAMKDYILLTTSGGKFITHMTMTHLASLLPDDQFRRVHRSFIVNLAHVTVWGKESVELGEIKVPIGQTYKSAKPE